MTKRITWLTIALLILAGAGYVFVQVRRHGFSAQAEPSRFEIWLARHARKIATPPDAKSLRNPLPATPEILLAGREHFADHCALCHGLDGRGRTTMGQNLYPKASDLTDAATQQLSDGELFYVIQNGIRFTGMPAWRSEHTANETWALVAFIRHLPKLTPEEIEEMRAKTAVQPAHTHEHGEHRHDSGHAH